MLNHINLAASVLVFSHIKIRYIRHKINIFMTTRNQVTDKLREIAKVEHARFMFIAIMSFNN